MLNILNNAYHLAYINFALVIIASLLILFYRYVYPKRKIHPVLMIIIFSLIASWSVFRPGTYQSGDLRTHTVQLMSFYDNLQQGNLFPIWAGQLCGGNGCPVLEFFYTLPYYIASFFHFVGFSYLTSLKILLAASFIISGLTMYLWAKDEFGKKAGIVASVFYLFAPYHLIDFHFRAGIGEVLSFVFIPLVFLFAKKIIESPKIKYILGLTLSISFLLMSHSSTTAAVLPILFIYALINWYYKKKKLISELLLFVIALIFSAGLLTYYWLPALSEVRYTWYGLWTVGDFRPIWEYLISPARYGLLFQGNHGEYRLIVGYFQLIAVIASIFLILKSKFDKRMERLLIFFIIFFFLFFFMMTESSKPLWESFSVLNTFLMVWRLLIPIAFITSAIAAIVSTKIKNDYLLTLICFATIVITLLNWGNRKMVTPPTNPFYAEVENYTEYVPYKNINSLGELPHVSIKYKIVTTSTARNVPIEFINGNGSYFQITRLEQKHEYVLKANVNSLIQENTYYFPGWKVYVDNLATPINYNNAFGSIRFSVNKGVHKVIVVLEDSQIRRISKYISLIFIVLLLVFLFSLKRIISLIDKVFRI